MNTMLPSGAVAVLTLIFSGCADMQWTKPGMDAAAAERELADCRVAARQRVLQRPVTMPNTTPQISGPAGENHPVVADAPVRQDERFLAEHEATRACMTRRGYRLERAG